MSKNKKFDPAEPEQSKVSAKKRSALLRYMAVLFVAAFILVAMSLVFDRNLSEERVNSQNALAKAEELQTSNRELEDKVVELQTELETAKTEAKDKQKLQQAYDSLVYVLTNEPVEGDVEFAKAQSALEENREYLSENAAAALDARLASLAEAPAEE